LHYEVHFILVAYLLERRFTKCLKGFDHISYAARLDRLKAETLESRRLKSDLIKTFSIIPGFVAIVDCQLQKA